MSLTEPNPGDQRRAVTAQLNGTLIGSIISGVDTHIDGSFHIDVIPRQGTGHDHTLAIRNATLVTDETTRGERAANRVLFTGARITDAAVDHADGTLTLTTNTDHTVTIHPTRPVTTIELLDGHPADPSPAQNAAAWDLTRWGADQALVAAY